LAAILLKWYTCQFYSILDQKLQFFQCLPTEKKAIQAKPGNPRTRLCIIRGIFIDFLINTAIFQRTCKPGRALRRLPQALNSGAGRFFA